ncbi:MAG: hypothetical protein AB1591_00940 [Pseudomonadota bacterium]
MLRKSLIASVLLAASGSIMAHGDYVYGRVVTVEPNYYISFGSGGYYGYRVLYESDGRHYWTHSHRHPGHVIWVPRPVVHHIHHHEHHHRHDHHHDWKHGKGVWRDDDRCEHHCRHVR